MSDFERKYSKYAIPNLSLYLIIAYVVGYVIELVSPEMYSFLEFNPYWVFHGQIWRIVTWILVPPEELGIFTIIMLLLYYQLGRGLEFMRGEHIDLTYIFSQGLYLPLLVHSFYTQCYWFYIILMCAY